MTSICSLQDRHSKECRSQCGLSGSIHSTRMIAPHVGQPGRSNTLGTESVGKGVFSNDQKNPVLATGSGGVWL